MSDWKKRNEDWRDEDELEEEEECECPWVDSKGKVRETAYCQYLLEKHPMMCLKQKLFDQNGEVDEDALLYDAFCINIGTICRKYVIKQRLTYSAVAKYHCNR